MADAYYESLKKTRTCPICGKKYVPAPEHMWKIGNWDGNTGERITRVCSYTCMRKWEKEQKAYDKRKHRNHIDSYEYKL